MLFGKKDAGEILNESYSIKFRKTDCSFGCTLQEHVGTKSVNSSFNRKTKTPNEGYRGILLHKKGKLTAEKLKSSHLPLRFVVRLHV